MFLCFETVLSSDIPSHPNSNLSSGTPTYCRPSGTQGYSAAIWSNPKAPLLLKLAATTPSHQWHLFTKIPTPQPSPCDSNSSPRHLHHNLYALNAAKHSQRETSRDISATPMYHLKFFLPALGYKQISPPPALSSTTLNHLYFSAITAQLHRSWHCGTPTIQKVTRKLLLAAPRPSYHQNWKGFPPPPWGPTCEPPITCNLCIKAEEIRYKDYRWLEVHRLVPKEEVETPSSSGGNLVEVLPAVVSWWLYNNWRMLDSKQFVLHSSNRASNGGRKRLGKEV